MLVNISVHLNSLAFRAFLGHKSHVRRPLPNPVATTESWWTSTYSCSHQSLCALSLTQWTRSHHVGPYPTAVATTAPWLFSVYPYSHHIKLCVLSLFRKSHLCCLHPIPVATTAYLWSSICPWIHHNNNCALSLPSNQPNHVATRTPWRSSVYPGSYQNTLCKLHQLCYSRNLHSSPCSIDSNCYCTLCVLRLPKLLQKAYLWSPAFSGSHLSNMGELNLPLLASQLSMCP